MHFVSHLRYAWDNSPYWGETPETTVINKAPREGGAAMLRRRLRMEEQELDLEFEVLNVQFNERGCYVLTLMVENPLLEDSGAGVQLKVNDGEVLLANGGSTEPIQQDNLDEIYTCLRSKFVFTLPKGFCKNDKNHDVRLRVEAVRLTDSQAAEGGGTRVGEGFFAIFPRTDAPRINMYAGREEELYHYRGTMALLRVHDDQLAMHCGRLAYAVAFHQSRPAPFLSLSPSGDVSGSAWEDGTSDWQTPRVPSPGPSSLRVPPLILGSPRLTDHPTAPGNSPRPGPQSSPRQPVPQPHLKSEIKPDATEDASRERLPTSPRIQAPQHQYGHPPALTPTPENPPRLLPESTPPGSSQLLPPTRVTECPPERNEAPRSPLSGDWHVSRPGKGALSVTLHRANSLPPLSHGGVPRPFVIAVWIDRRWAAQQQNLFGCWNSLHRQRL
ncbi:hypothetical protein AAFF_G00224440 [Aldrovandia affinis]|uniref:Uncharacterized protein n=1 Tax=Aldrovandia affinis TaxID=143900 RepID=A0AAD7TAX0_9TELE|nr:hypothetical protein AAFF_G00224440 [Aldrovandia affinis]